MTTLLRGGIDCDIHPAVPNIQALLPYLEDHWREMAITRGIDDLVSISYPLNSPLTSRPRLEACHRQGRRLAGAGARRGA